MSTPPTYVPLWIKSSGSMLEGASHPEELVDQAASLGLPAMALTDRDGVYAATRAHVAVRARMRPDASTSPSPRLILGAQVSVSVAASPALPGLVHKADLDRSESLLLLAERRQGYRNLCRLLTRGHHRAPQGSRPRHPGRGRAARVEPAVHLSVDHAPARAP